MIPFARRVQSLIQGQMSISTSHQNLFRVPATADKLSFLRLLFDADELNVELTFAMLRVIHRELGNRQTSDRSVYKTYARAIQSLRHHKADMLEEVVATWEADKEKSAKDPEWLADGLIK